jgi:hypothetical protein
MRFLLGVEEHNKNPDQVPVRGLKEMVGMQSCPGWHRNNDPFEKSPYNPRDPC